MKEITLLKDKELLFMKDKNYAIYANKSFVMIKIRKVNMLLIISQRLLSLHPRNLEELLIIFAIDLFKVNYQTLLIT